MARPKSVRTGLDGAAVRAHFIAHEEWMAQGDARVRRGMVQVSPMQVVADYLKAGYAYRFRGGFHLGQPPGTCRDIESHPLVLDRNRYYSLLPDDQVIEVDGPWVNENEATVWDVRRAVNARPEEIGGR